MLPYYVKNPSALRLWIELLLRRFNCWFSFNVNYAFVFLLFLPALYHILLSNGLEYLVTLPFYFFQYPLDVDLRKVVKEVMNNQQPDAEPINVERFPIIMDTDKLCRDYDGEIEDIFILYVVKSRPENYASRQAIRETWGQNFLIPGLKTRVVFILGVIQGNQEVQKRVGMEHEDYNDIVQGFFRDHRLNDTGKVMMGFQWATSRCQGASFIAFLDDQFFISTYNLVKYLRDVPMSKLHNYMVGYVWHYGSPSRDHGSEDYVSLDHYPYMFWPPYPAAGAFIISQEVAQKMYLAMHYTKHLKFDDVFVGIVAWKLKIKMENIDNFYYLESEKSRVNMRHRDVIGCHKFTDPDDLQALWRRHYSMMSRLGRA